MNLNYLIDSYLKATEEKEYTYEEMYGKEWEPEGN